MLKEPLPGRQLVLAQHDSLTVSQAAECFIEMLYFHIIIILIKKFPSKILQIIFYRIFIYKISIL